MDKKNSNKYIYIYKHIYMITPSKARGNSPTDVQSTSFASQKKITLSNFIY